jgi:glycosyltransferase involved in cell wall biosynthesis
MPVASTRFRNRSLRVRGVDCVPNLAVIILTHNEALHLDRALRAISTVASEIFVIDSGSTDRTIEIAIEHGATVLQRRWINYAYQFQWALDNAPITADWVMRLDADEVVEPDLAIEIADRLPKLPIGVAGVNLNRKHIFMGRWIRHGGRYPLLLLRIWRRGKARIEQRWMDEHMLLTEGRTVTFNGGFSDINLNNISFFVDKHNRYATREAVDVINQRRTLFRRDIDLNHKNTSKMTSLIRFSKERIYNQLPFEVSATCYFLLRYIFQLGFLDGREGAIYHFMQGFWYRFTVGAKIVELNRSLGSLTGPAATIKLEELTGLKLSPPRDFVSNETNINIASDPNR